MPFPSWACMLWTFHKLFITLCNFSCCRSSSAFWLVALCCSWSKGVHCPMFNITFCLNDIITKALFRIIALQTFFITFLQSSLPAESYTNLLPGRWPNKLVSCLRLDGHSLAGKLPTAPLPCLHTTAEIKAAGCGSTTFHSLITFC